MKDCPDKGTVLLSPCPDKSARGTVLLSGWSRDRRTVPRVEEPSPASLRMGYRDRNGQIISARFFICTGISCLFVSEPLGMFIA